MSLSSLIHTNYTHTHTHTTSMFRDGTGIQKRQFGGKITCVCCVWQTSVSCARRMGSKVAEGYGVYVKQGRRLMLAVTAGTLTLFLLLCSYGTKDPLLWRTGA